MSGHSLSGRPARECSPKRSGGWSDASEYLVAIREHEPAATAEVAEAVGVTRQGADYRLRRLEEQGEVRHKKAGNSLIWFVVDQEGDE